MSQCLDAVEPLYKDRPDALGIFQHRKATLDDLLLLVLGENRFVGSFFIFLKRGRNNEATLLLFPFVDRRRVPLDIGGDFVDDFVDPGFSAGFSWSHAQLGILYLLDLPKRA